MAQSFIYAVRLIHMDLDCPVLKPGQVYVLDAAEALIAARNKDGDLCVVCVRPSQEG